MYKEIITFCDIEIEKTHVHRSPILIDDVDTDKILISKKVSSSEKNMNALLVTKMMIIKLSHCA